MPNATLLPAESKPVSGLPAVTSLTIPELPARSTLEVCALELLNDAMDLEVDGQATYELGADIIKSVNRELKDFEEKRLAHTRPLDQYKSDVIAHYAGVVDTFHEALTMGKSKLLTYDQEQQRKREEVERQARQAAEIERKKQQEAAAEEARKSREAEEKAAAERRAAEEARQREENARRQAEDAKRRGDEEAARKAEQERLAAEQQAQAASQNAAQLEAVAETSAQNAAEINVQAEVMSVPAVAIAAPRVRGISTSWSFSAEVVDLKALLQAIVDGKEPVALIDMDALNKTVSARARTDKDQFVITGCKLIKSPKMAAGRK